MAFTTSRFLRSFLLLGSLLLLGACSPPQILDLTRIPASAYYVDSRGTLEAPPPKSWQQSRMELRDEFKEQAGPRVWIRYDLPQGSDYVYAQDCANVTAIYQGDQLLKKDDSLLSFPHSVRLFAQKPFFALPNPESSLYLQTFYSASKGYAPACNAFFVGSRNRVLWYFSTADSAMFICGFIVFFLGISGLVLSCIGFSLSLFYFSTFALAMGTLFVASADLANLMIASAHDWHELGHFAFLFVSIPFFLLFDSVIKSSFRLARKMALVNLLIFMVVRLVDAFYPDFDLELFRLYFSRLLLAELLIFVPVIIHSIYLGKQNALSFGGSFLCVLLSGAFDIYMGIVGKSFAPTSPIVFLIFSVFALISLIRIKIQESATREREKLNWIQERNRRLQSEVEKRTEALGNKSIELETAHLELEERLEFLVAQKRRVAELAQQQDKLLQGIASIHRSIVPDLVLHLQIMHEKISGGIDASIHYRVVSGIKDIEQILNPLAQLYKERIEVNQSLIHALCTIKKHQRTFKLALGGSQIEFHIAETPEDFSLLLKERASDIMVVDEPSQHLISHYHETNPKATIVLISESSPLQVLEQLEAYTMLNQVFSLLLPKNIVPKMLNTHFSKFINHDVFGVEKYLMWGSVVKERPLLARATLDSTMAAVRKDLDLLDLTDELMIKFTAACRCLLVLQESYLLTKNVDTERSIRQIRFGYDANLIAISIDLPGHLLSRQEILNAFKICKDPSLDELISLSHAVVLNSDGQERHELLAIRYDAPLDPENRAFFYPFILA